MHHPTQPIHCRPWLRNGLSLELLESHYESNYGGAVRKSRSEPVAVYCADGFHVGCKTAIALRDAGFDARFMKGGHSAWKAIGGATKAYREPVPNP